MGLREMLNLIRLGNAYRCIYQNQRDIDRARDRLAKAVVVRDQCQAEINIRENERVAAAAVPAFLQKGVVRRIGK